MRIFLRNFRMFADRMAIEVDFDHAAVGSAADLQGRLLGLFCRLASDTVGLFVMHRQIFIYLNGNITDVTNQAVVATYFKKGDLRELKLDLGNKQYVITYPDQGPPFSTVFWTEDEEDADFGLLLENVLSSAERRQVIISGFPRMDADERGSKGG